MEFLSCFVLRSLRNFCISMQKTYLEVRLYQNSTCPHRTVPDGVSHANGISTLITTFARPGDGQSRTERTSSASKQREIEKGCEAKLCWMRDVATGSCRKSFPTLARQL